MNNSLFETITYHIDAWNGEVAQTFECSGTQSIKLSIRANKDGPTDKQKKLFKDLTDRYEVLWPTIAKELIKLNPAIKDSAELPSSLDPQLLLYIPGVIGDQVFDFTIGFKFKSDRGKFTAYFVSYVGWEIKICLKAS